MKTTLTLDPSSLVLPAGFSLVGSFPSSVAAGDLTQVTIQLDAAALGSSTRGRSPSRIATADRAPLRWN